MSAPQLALNAMLNYIDLPIYIIIDPERYPMIKQNIRGGMSRFSPIRSRKQQIDGNVLRFDQADVLHNVRWHQQSLRVGDVAAASGRRLGMSERQGMLRCFCGTLWQSFSRSVVWPREALHFRSRLKLFARVAWARRWLPSRAGDDDYRWRNHRWKAASAPRQLLYSSLSVQSQARVLVSSEAEIRHARASPLIWPRLRHKNCPSAPSYPLYGQCSL